jgi:hypothetical protein
LWAATGIGVAGLCIVIAFIVGLALVLPENWIFDDDAIHTRQH